MWYKQCVNDVTATRMQATIFFLLFFVVVVSLFLSDVQMRNICYILFNECARSTNTRPTLVAKAETHVSL